MQESELSGDRTMTCDIPGQATAGTADEWVIGVMGVNAVITKVEYISKTAVTGAATNNCAITCRNRAADASGSTQVAITTFANTVNTTAFVPSPLTLSATAANLNVSKGDILTAEKLVNASGLALPGGKVRVTYRAR